MGKTYPYYRYAWNACHSSPKNYPSRLCPIKRSRGPSSSGLTKNIFSELNFVRVGREEESLIGKVLKIRFFDSLD